MKVIWDFYDGYWFNTHGFQFIYRGIRLTYVESGSNKRAGKNSFLLIEPKCIKKHA